MKTSSFVLGIATGLLGSATAILLTTPKSGKDLRLSLKEAKDAANNQVQDLKLQVANIKESVQQIQGEVKDKGPKFAKDVKSSIEKFQQETAPIQEHLKQEITALQNSVEEIQQEIANFQNRKAKNKS
ncbi:YtxH domain-containing protein [Rummeliibacillus sp. JY-2-4R]